MPSYRDKETDFFDENDKRLRALPLAAPSDYRAEPATASAARSRGWGCTARAGSDVSTTQIVAVAGSAQAIVPVEPV